MRPVAIAGTAALSAFGAGTRGIAAALERGAALPGMPADAPLANPRARKMMSRAAYYAARCLAALLHEVGWAEAREEIGCFLGVGASGGTMDDMIALIDASIVDGELSMPRFGDRGLAACNPLLAFQLMNNFTMCHGAILEHLGGPNGAFFSRGSGTIAAVAEAVHAVSSGDCDRAICGGADTPTHPVTMAELQREGFLARGMAPADGVGLLAIHASGAGAGAGAVAGAVAGAGAGAVIEHCDHVDGRGRTIAASVDAVLRTAPVGAFDALVIAPWGPEIAEALVAWATAARAPRVVDVRALGETVAAGPALAAIAAADAVADGAARVLVLTAGIDGDVGAIVIARGAG